MARRTQGERAGEPREQFFLVGANEEVLYRDAGDSALSIPDSRARWEAIWEHRERLVELAHSHPVGPLAFSREDETTMAALETALGRKLVFSVVAPRGMIRRQDGKDEIVSSEPEWARELRRVSGMRLRGESGGVDRDDPPDSGPRG